MNTTDTNDKTLRRFLIPLDTGASYDRPISFMKCLIATLGRRIEKVTLLHVMAGRYLSQHMTNVDIRVSSIISTDKFRRLRSDYLDRQIRPVLEAAKKELESAGIQAPVEIVIDDGEPVEQIVKKANEDDYSTLILQRSNASRVEEMFVGSVTSGVLHREVKGTIYLPGMGQIGGAACPPKSCLIALGASPCDQVVLERASVLLAACGDNLEKVVLTHVLDVVKCSEEMGNGTVSGSYIDDLLGKAADFLAAQGIAKNKIIQAVGCGNPADVLVDEINMQEVGIVFMGRRDRTALKELFMGSISRKIIYRCSKRTVVLVSAV
ncbi:MAG: universal stress protein [Deltaproteobacteria bacterium]|nr:universal stress protein [Deltaproteobacteria bacterium]